MKKSGSWMLLSLILLVFNSCSSVYKPVRVSTMTLTEPREVHASGSISPSGNDIQIAFAPLKYVGVYGNINRFSPDNIQKPPEERSFHNSKEAGLGFWYLFDNDIHVEISGGYGTGAGQMRPASFRTGISENASTYFYDYDRFEYSAQLSGFYEKIVLNAGISYVQKNFDLSLHFRYTEGRYENLRAFAVHDDTGEREELPEWAGPVERSPFSYLDPTITLRGGYEAVKLILQAGLSRPYQVAPDFPSLLFFSGGVSINLKPGMLKKLKKNDS